MRRSRFLSLSRRREQNRFYRWFDDNIPEDQESITQDGPQLECNKLLEKEDKENGN